MRRLGPRQDHVLRQVKAGRVSLRGTTLRNLYSWCIDCGSNVSRQTRALSGRNMIRMHFKDSVSTAPSWLVDAYGEKYLKEHPL